MSRNRILEKIYSDTYSKPNNTYINSGDQSRRTHLDNKETKVTRTSPREKGHINLRIKSSKAFPPSEITVIEDMI